MSTRRILFWAFVAVQAFVPVAIFGLREATAAFAPHVLLHATPVDPRDPFRGQYVAVRLDVGYETPPPGAREGQVVYVHLQRTPTGSRGDYASLTPPDGTSIRGNARNGAIDFGRFRYYVSEDEAERWQNAFAGGNVHAELALARDGRPLLRRLITR
jgi:uncharacterized membrane-anchored protein